MWLIISIYCASFFSTRVLHVTLTYVADLSGVAYHLCTGLAVGFGQARKGPAIGLFERLFE